MRLFSKRILGNCNWLFARSQAFSEEILADLPSLFEKLGVEYILFGGDFTTTALEEEFRVARQFVDQFTAAWFAIPGNHDVYTYRSQRKKTFYQFFPPKKGEDLDPFDLAKDHIKAYRLNDTYWLILLDVCRATNFYSSRGLFSEKIEQFMKKILSSIPSKDSIIVNCHYPFFQHDAHRRTLKRGECLKKILQEDPRIRLFLHGHTHRQTIANLLPSGLPVVLDSGSCAQKDRASWNLIDLNREGCTITAYHYQNTWKPLSTEEISWKS